MPDRSAVSLDFAACRRARLHAAPSALLRAPDPARARLRMGMAVHILATGMEGRFAAYDGRRVIVRLADGDHRIVPLAGVEPAASAPGLDPCPAA